jgi:ATP-dependent Lhr-like helicase
VAKDPLGSFHAPVRDWFRASLGEPTRAQALGWPAIARGESTLILAPTGSGKTLAAFLAAIDRLMWSEEPPKKARCRVLYVSPLKALAVDVERNLRSPLAGVIETARARPGGDAAPRVPSVDVRTGDTPQADRARMMRAPPDILITTPESLYLILTSSARAILESIDVVIIDEIHSMVPTKRGAHLFLTLERLEELRPKDAAPLQRIGLSATQRPLDEVARLLGGLDARGAPRPVTIIDAGEKKRFDLTVEVPDIDMARLGEIDELASGPAAAGGARRSIWPHVHERLVALIKEHRSTLVFVNSRRLAERLASALNEVAGDEIALAHHGSVAREKRSLIEDRLKRGLLPAIIATSSLELGIDMGAIDLVVQIEAPPSVASGMQRIGRASHNVGGVPTGILVPKHRADLLACAAATAGMRAGEVEETFYPRNPLDVLAQQIVAIASMGSVGVDELYTLVRQAAPFAELPRGAYEGVLDMLSGRYPSDEFSELRPRITWDRSRGKLHARQGAQRLAIVNGGTIPDRGLYGVFLSASAGGDGKTSRRVGELDEEMVFELREGEVFLLGASSWRADEITHERVNVSPAAGEPGKMPFWHGDRAGRPRAFGIRIGALTRQLARTEAAAAESLLTGEYQLDASAAKNLVAYVHDQVEATTDVPSDRTIVVERFLDELGDWRVCVLSPFGARVHAPWATAVMARLTDQHMGDVESVWSDDGMVFRLPASDTPPDVDAFLPASDEVERIVTDSLGSTSLFAARFRENASRALLLPRKFPGKRTPLWAQRKRAYDLLAVASRHPSFPMLLETYRECLRDVFDLPGLVDTLRRVESRQIRVSTRDTRVPSPFAASLLFSFVANFIYDGDAPLAERRAQALTIDHAQLRELLGEAELRQLLDPEILEEHERTLQRKTHPARHMDGIHDMLLAIGDLTLDELRERVTPPERAEEWILALERDRRAVSIKLHAARASEPRWIAIEDVGRFRDAIGVVPPRGVPAAFLEPVKDAVSDLVARYARTHGPFVPEAIMARFGIAASSVSDAVDRLVRAGRIVDGAFLPSGHTRELCDAEVLRVLRRKSLARLRREIEPVDAAAYGRFLLEWQGITHPRRGQEALLAVVAQLQGCPLPASTLETQVLPMRIEGFRAWDLDALCASGQVVWAGVEPLGPNDGRIALYLADQEALLAGPTRLAEGEAAAKIRALLERRGAVFFPEIAREAGGFPTEVLDALWDMVWCGEVTNDTLEPLRSLLRAKSTTASRKDMIVGRSRGYRTSHTVPAGSQGRWSLRASRWSEAPTPTEKSTALARALLERYGVLTREATHAEGIVGGFSAVYDVLKAMEESARIRRGYFVAERGATQFALPGADDRLRSMRSGEETPRLLVIAATDPANPYGATLPWPARPGDEDKDRARPQRAAGARVVLYDGALIGWLGRGLETVQTFLPKEEPERGAASAALANALAGMVESGQRRAILLTTIDGEPATQSDFGAALLEAGFTVGGGGYMRRARNASIHSRPRERDDAGARGVVAEDEDAPDDGYVRSGDRGGPDA